MNESSECFRAQLSPQWPSGNTEKLSRTISNGNGSVDLLAYTEVHIHVEVLLYTKPASGCSDMRCQGPLSVHSITCL